MIDARETAREAAQAFSEGLNCIAEIVATLKTEPASPSLSSWLAAIEAMERALEVVRAKEVWSSMVVTEEQIDRIRQVRLALSHWQDTNQPPKELRTLAEGILRSFNL
jgi:hypothetical protein